MSNLVQDAKILGIQFSILSPEEIRKSSVAKITNRDTYINNKPVPNGLLEWKLMPNHCWIKTSQWMIFILRFPTANMEARFRVFIRITIAIN